MSVKYMKLGFENLVIDENNFYNLKMNNNVIGFNLDLRINYYRGLPLSCLKKLSVTVDGEVIPKHLILFCINGKKFSTEQIPQLFAEYWGINTTVMLV